jgi:hypothetical protein
VLANAVPHIWHLCLEGESAISRQTLLAERDRDEDGSHGEFWKMTCPGDAWFESEIW